MVITFSAGNEGIDANADGSVDNDSTGSPATAKNVITIGASENQRPAYPCDTNLTYTSHDAYQPSQTCNGMGGNNTLGTYGGRWGTDYPVTPIANDLTAGNPEQMAAFSAGAGRRRAHQARRGGARHLGALDVFRPIPGRVRRLA